MKQASKPKRRYDSSRRVAQARATRRTIVEAAHRLFLERGYAGATVELIAQAAEVAPETVYAAFGNKRTLLARVIEMSVGGDDEPLPLLERPGPRGVLSEQDPRRQVERFAQDIAAILERVAPLFEVMRMAAKTEPEIDDLLQSILQERLRNISVFVRRVFEHGQVRPDLAESHAAETVWTLSSPEVFRLLTVDRNWSREQYSQWLADALGRLLLA